MGLIRLLDSVVFFYDKLVTGELMQKIVTDNEKLICDMNAISQLYDKGENANGVDIWSYMPYRPFTIEIKNQKGQPANRVTLRDTGVFQQSFYLETTRTKFAITSDDDKTDELVDKYGADIFGLNKENKARLQRICKNEILKTFKEYLK